MRARCSCLRREKAGAWRVLVPIAHETAAVTQAGGEVGKDLIPGSQERFKNPCALTNCHLAKFRGL